MLPHKGTELWNAIRKYYHDPDAPITKCVVKLTMPHHGSHIECEYGEGYEAKGGLKALSFEDICFLFDELKECGVGNIKQTQELIVTIEVGKPVTVTQSYYL